MAICHLVNVHLVFVIGLYKPYWLSCSACQILSCSAVIKEGFIQVGCRSADGLRERALPPGLLHRAVWKSQMLTSGLLMFLSPQVHSLMWRGWFLRGCFSSQRNVRFQSPIKEVLATGILQEGRNFEDEKLLVCTTQRRKTVACIYYSLLSCRYVGAGVQYFARLICSWCVLWNRSATVKQWKSIYQLQVS